MYTGTKSRAVGQTDQPTQLIDRITRGKKKRTHISVPHIYVYTFLQINFEMEYRTAVYKKKSESRPLTKQVPLTDLYDRR